ncbi:hypothetical protein M885DRAFT_552577 [Pelagophyceae sp. CCMP2097]|nr:hypothetical protein M885DRAFT_552577 [Pelagophyceae sp. CCMP2097]
MLFGSVYHLIRTSKAYKSSVSTYEGRVDVVKVRNTVAFSTFAEVLALFGLDRYCAVAHIGLVPAAVLKHDFDENDKAWGKIVGTGLPPIALSRSVGGGETLMSDVGRAAAAIARTVVVFVIDKKEESPAEEKLYFIFVARGYARTLKPAILFELVPGFKMLGHVGWIPARVLTWKHAPAHVISATFVSTTMRSSGMPIRSYTNKPIPVFKYKPVLVVASSGILK